MGVFSKIKNVIIGRARNPLDNSIFHKLSLIAFFAWIGLGADGLSSSCYGPEAAFLALQGHTALSIFVALATAVTIFLICASYSQIIEIFPSGGGGYLVASKLLSPAVGVFSGCALIVDYVFTIAISIASGVDAVFSFLPPQFIHAKLTVSICGVLLLLIMNMRGVKESVVPLVPIFLLFVLTHVAAIVYAIVIHAGQFPALVESTRAQTAQLASTVGAWGVFFLIMRAYSLGAGTFTGIEAVSNGLPILREPKVATGKKTIQYMAFSLAFVVFGLMLAYLLFSVSPVHGKTLNAVLFENISAGWGRAGYIFVVTILLSEGFLLLISAQTGFLGGPRVIASMAIDRWLPNRFANLSDRLVTQNGILLMGLGAMITLALTRGSVQIIVVLYSINVFITFFLSQLGMVRHWWNVRVEEKSWLRKMLVNGSGLILTTFILISVVVIKFGEGGWVTLLITGSLSVCAFMIKHHYRQVGKLLQRLNTLTDTAVISPPDGARQDGYDPKGKTAVFMVSGFNGLGLHTLFNAIRLFGRDFRNLIFVQISVIDAGNFKGVKEVSRLELEAKKELKRYVEFMKGQGFYAEGLSFTGVDVVSESDKVIALVQERFPKAVVFGGQLVFPRETLWTRLLHNDTVFTLQRRFYQQGIPFVVLPIRI